MAIRQGGGPVLGPKRSKKALFALNMPKKFQKSPQNDVFGRFGVPSNDSEDNELIYTSQKTLSPQFSPYSTILRLKIGLKEYFSRK